MVSSYTVGIITCCVTSLSLIVGLITYISVTSEKWSRTEEKHYQVTNTCIVKTGVETNGFFAYLSSKYSYFILYKAGEGISLSIVYVEDSYPDYLYEMSIGSIILHTSNDQSVYYSIYTSTGITIRGHASRTNEYNVIADNLNIKRSLINRFIVFKLCNNICSIYIWIEPSLLSVYPIHIPFIRINETTLYSYTQLTCNDYKDRYFNGLHNSIYIQL